MEVVSLLEDLPFFDFRIVEYVRLEGTGPAWVCHLDIVIGLLLLSLAWLLVIGPLEFGGELCDAFASEFALYKLAQFPVDFVEDVLREGLESFELDLVVRYLRVKGPKHRCSRSKLKPDGGFTIGLVALTDSRFGFKLSDNGVNVMLDKGLITRKID